MKMGLRRLAIGLLISLILIGPSAASDCPAALPAPCTCENLVDGFRVSCLENADLNGIISALKDDYIDKLDIRNCATPIKNLVNLPAMNVRSLTISGCGIEHVAEKAFSKLAANLEELKLSNNSLSTMPLWGEMPKLEALNLNYNLLTDIPEAAFDALPKLRFLRVKGNKLKALSNNALNETKPTLELLDLSSNVFSMVPARNLRNSPKLMHLDLSGNAISELGKFSFMNLPSLKELRLNSNRIGVLAPMAFMNVPDLSHLHVRDNLLKEVQPGILKMFKQLEIVDLSQNSLIKIPPFNDMPNLKNIKIDSNKFRRIDTMTFAANPKLQIISVQNNEISLIAKNAFDGLDQLVILLLGNNSLSTIEKGAFDGIKNLQQLTLHNNSIVEVSNVSLISLPKLNVLDLSDNKLRRIAPGAFTAQKNLYWLDLSDNGLQTFEKGVFEQKISNIILDGNNFTCDEKFDWFVTYLVQKQVRTFVASGQPEIACAAPPKYLGVRLKDLMIKKANETLTQSMNTLGFNSNSNTGANAAFLASLLPSLLGGQSQAAGGAGGVLAQLTQAMPSLRNIPGMNYGNGRSGGAMGQANANLDSAIEQFTEPLVRFATGGQPVPSDIRQFIDSIPNLVVNIPGFGNIDLKKIPPPILEHVLKGGQVPGIPRETLDLVVKKYTQQMYEAAERAQNNRARPDDEKFLPPLTTLPQELVSTVMNGDSIPHLSNEQSNTIRRYYAQQIPVAFGNSSSGSPQFSPEMFSMLNLLPPNYNFSKIPAEVIQAVMKGEMPDLSLLPQDVIDHLRENSDKMFKSFKLSPNMTIEEILSKLPRFEPALLPVTFTPYDINQVDSDLVIKSEKSTFTASQLRLYTAIAIAFFAAISAVILALFCWHLRRDRVAGSGRDSQTAPVVAQGIEEEYASGSCRNPSQFSVRSPVHSVVNDSFSPTRAAVARRLK
uniref:LRRCT domain-containing protein n=1 Tax=Panagrellus redivivus TaxID=6233 RepID=A0A7E4WCZ6_PANRE